MSAANSAPWTIWTWFYALKIDDVSLFRICDFALIITHLQLVDIKILIPNLNERKPTTVEKGAEPLWKIEPLVC